MIFNSANRIVPIFCKYIFTLIWKTDFYREERQTDPPFAVHCPDGHNVQSWADSKLGASSCFWLSRTGQEHQGLGPFSPAFQDCMQKVWFELEQPGCEPAPTWDAGAQSWRISLCVNPQRGLSYQIFEQLYQLLVIREYFSWRNVTLQC